MTTRPGIFVAGDMGRGQCLIVWAIAEGRACAAGVDEYLMGETRLPAPVRRPTGPWPSCRPKPATVAGGSLPPTTSSMQSTTRVGI